MSTKIEKSELKKHKSGFSLVEVNLAIFVVAIGLLTLFTLFPAGLKEGEAGHADTQTSLFADYVLTTLRTEALAVISDDWESLPVQFPSGIKEKKLDAIEFPTGSGQYVRYYLEIVDSGDNYQVRLWVAGGRYGTNLIRTFKESSKMYYTELFFSGMP